MKGDIVNKCIEKMTDADGIVLASPTYFADVSTGMRALIERAGYVAKANDDMFRAQGGGCGRGGPARRKAGKVAILFNDITERIRDQEELKRRHDDFNNAYEAVHRDTGGAAADQ